MVIYVARLDTENFEFRGYGHSRHNARQALKDAWATHQERTGAWLTWAELKSSVYVEAVKLGSFTIH